MLLVGTGSFAQVFADWIDGRPDLGVRVIGHVAPSDEAHGGVSRPVLGTVQDISALFHGRVVDEVATCLSEAHAGWVEPVTRLAADEGKTVRIPLDPGDNLVMRGREEEFEGFRVRSVVNDERRELALVTKRLVDIAGSAVGLVILSPVLLGVALLARRAQVVLARRSSGCVRHDVEHDPWCVAPPSAVAAAQALALQDGEADLGGEGSRAARCRRRAC
jgi:hypothetical protein